MISLGLLRSIIHQSNVVAGLHRVAVGGVRTVDPDFSRDSWNASTIGSALQRAFLSAPQEAFFRALKRAHEMLAHQ